MANTKKLSRLEKQLAYLIGLEMAIDYKLTELIPLASEYSKAAELLNSFAGLQQGHITALENRFKFLTSDRPRLNSPAEITAGDGMGEEVYPISNALQQAHNIFNQAIIGYSLLEAMGTRFRDSPYLADEGTSFHLANQHMADYTRAIAQITLMLHDVLLWELDSEGHECQCLCPGCGAGVCLCSMAGRIYLERAWKEADPILEEKGIYVQRPKQNSAAETAGLERGDVILSAGGEEADSFMVLQGAIGDAGPGGEVQLMVHRKSVNTKEAVSLYP